ncbi:hypothetical protein ABB07_38645 [Streptomyces incarnatus]|uniref:Uncharacterized protein n=1 Tax=Streptomyces incarnatus TaxID=665007 RepID=A0ABM5TX91_9ACTN|nr:hypothetical protein [Streptomyces incarnatus]AKJ15752.1 hypothetical protein ABB07_38645 [Streptomyces incarnatus]
MAATAAEDAGATAVAAEPRPRSPFEETWEEAVVDVLPLPEEDMPGMAPSEQARRPWGDGSRPPDPPGVGEITVDVPRPWAERPALDEPRSSRSYAPVGNGESPLSGPRSDVVDPRPTARPSDPARADGPTAGAGTDEMTMTHTGRPPQAPDTPPVDTPRPPAPVHVPPPHVDGDGAAPARTAAVPADDASFAPAATASDVVRAEPVPVESQPREPQAEFQAEFTPVVVEIGRVEVRVVPDRPSEPPRERRTRPRTGPTLDEYLGSAAGRGAS